MMNNIKDTVKKIHYSHDLTPMENMLKLFLMLMSIPYIIAVTLRYLMYETGIKKAHSVPEYVISVGNLTTGGSGKTPLTAEIAKTLQIKGFRTAILSRGYGGTLSQKNTNVIADGEKIYYNAQEAGDEPYWLAKNTYGSRIITGKNRYKSALFAEKNLGVDVFILDDGYQHLPLHRNLDILVIDYVNKFGNNQVLPAGPLREPLSEIRRADKIVVVNKKPHDEQEVKDCRAYARYLAEKYDKQVFVCNMKPLGIFNLMNGDPLPYNSKIFAFSGIGQPQSFFDNIENSGYNLIKTKTFDDHYLYQEYDFMKILADSKECGADAIVTTEKDAVKIQQFLYAIDDEIPFYVLKLGVDIEMDVLLEEMNGYV